MRRRNPISFERLLAGRIMAAWFVVSILSIAVRIGNRMMQNQRPNARLLMWTEFRWLMMIVFAGILTVVAWRAANGKFRFVRVGLTAAALFVLFEFPVEGVYRLAIELLPRGRTQVSTLVVANVANDLIHFAIVTLATVAATWTVRAYRASLAAEHEAAILEAQVADARVRLLRTQVKPALVRQSLEHIEALLVDDPRRAEAAVYGLSDFLRLALQRAREMEWDDAKEARYLDLQEQVRAECSGAAEVSA